MVTLGRLRQEDYHKLKANLRYVVKPCLKQFGASISVFNRLSLEKF